MRIPTLVRTVLASSSEARPHPADRGDRFFRRWTVASTITPARAREILGQNCLVIVEVQKHFGVTYTPEQLHHLAEIPFSTETLQECKDTHILFPGAPLSILDLRSLLLFSGTLAWCELEAFATEEVAVRWYLLRTEPQPGSFRKTFAEQTALLAAEDEIPRVCEVAYALLLHHRATGKRLLEKVYVRCADQTSIADRIHGGGFDRRGMFIGNTSKMYRDEVLGLAVARKPSRALPS